MMKAVLVVLLGLSSAAFAGNELNRQIHNSYLTLTAFDCALVAPEEDESKRLFNFGLNAGREFIAYAKQNRETYVQELMSRVATVWNTTGGPTADFILGEIYAMRAQEVHKTYASAPDQWRRTNSGLITI